MESEGEGLPSDIRIGLLDPVDRISEILFGLIMAVTIVGSLSVATAGQNEVRTVMAAALGCNLAWGLVDAVMYLVRMATAKTRNRALAKRIRHADAKSAQRLIAQALPEHVAAIVGADDIERMRGRLLALPPSGRPAIQARAFLEAFGIFLMVVVATFPVVAPFALIDEVARAMRWSQAITLGMLFLAGVALGRYAGHLHPLLMGIAMAVFGAVLITVVKALGG